MVAGAIAGNISAEATTPTGNSFAEAMRGVDRLLMLNSVETCKWPHGESVSPSQTTVTSSL